MGTGILECNDFVIAISIKHQIITQYCERLQLATYLCALGSHVPGIFEKFRLWMNGLQLVSRHDLSRLVSSPVSSPKWYGQDSLHRQHTSSTVLER